MLFGYINKKKWGNLAFQKNKFDWTLLKISSNHVQASFFPFKVLKQKMASDKFANVNITKQSNERIFSKL